jgi:hypothetical protein
VTTGVRNAAGNPIGSQQFRHFLIFGQTNDADETAYRQQLLTALVSLQAAGVPPGTVAAASIFTTQTATTVLEKIRDQIAAMTPAPADFLLGAGGTPTVFPLTDVTTIAFTRQVGTAPTSARTPSPSRYWQSSQLA